MVPYSNNAEISSLNLFQTVGLRRKLLAKESYLTMEISGKEQDLEDPVSYYQFSKNVDVLPYSFYMSDIFLKHPQYIVYCQHQN